MDDLGDLLASLAECEKTAETNEALNRVRIYIERKQAHNNVLISLAHEYQYLSNQYRKYLDSLCLMRGTIDMEYMKAWVDVLDTLKCDASATDSVSAVQLRIMNLQKQAFLTQAPLAKSSASSAPSAILESLQIKRCNIKKLRSTLKTTLEQNRASQLEMSERMVGWKSNHAVLDAKRTDYHERIQQATIELDKARYAPDIDYNHICDMADEFERHLAQAEERRRELEVYRDLKPEIELAKKQLLAKQQELAAAKQEYRKVIERMMI